MDERRISRIPGSFRDPSGFVFQRDGQIFRQINKIYQEDYDRLISSGLYHRLTTSGLLVKHQETQINPPSPENCYKVIHPEQVGFISYPYEWSFSQLKDAALLTLAVQKEALQAGMILKDASAYNIQFCEGAPLFIDTLSFTRYQKDSPWVAYRQFCQHFLAPLALMSLTHIQLNKLLQLDMDGIPLALASRLLPWNSRFNIGLQMHIHLHAYAQNITTKQKPASQAKKGKVSYNALVGLIESLEKTVSKLRWKPKNTAWVDYYQFTNYSDDALDAKSKIVRDILHQISPKSVFDLGANTGEFSRLARDIQGCRILSVDSDPGAVEVNYLACKKSDVRNVLPLVIDLSNPSPAVGWGNTERQSFIGRSPVDVVMALALIHHLAISNNVPLADIAQLMAALGDYLIIEFVPKEDSQVIKLLSSRDDIFPDYSRDGFIGAFSRFFQLQQETPIPATMRSIYLFKRVE